MNNPDNYSHSDSSDSEIRELRRDMQKSTHMFSTQMAAVVLCLVVFNFSVNIFIFKQLSYVRHQETELVESVENYRTNSSLQMNKFLAELRVFSASNKDFYDSVLSQFPLQGTNSPAPVPTNSPKPAAPKK